MDINAPIDRAYPKVKPLTRALMEAAAEQGATLEEFRMAVVRIESMAERKASGILIAELKGECTSVGDTVLEQTEECLKGYFTNRSRQGSDLEDDSNKPQNV